uniref:Uncharacterized protein n=1 Tax=Zosterops lateralis melanops TaxID=1220523 RepID=A0A8D2QKU4_ZOSLA
MLYSPGKKTQKPLKIWDKLLEIPRFSDFSITQRFSAAASLTSLHLFAVLRHVVRADGPQEFDVIIAVVLGHLLCISLVRTLQGHQHKPIVKQQVVGHADPVGFHGMSLAIIIIPNIPWKGNPSPAPLGLISPPAVGGEKCQHFFPAQGYPWIQRRQKCGS